MAWTPTEAMRRTEKLMLELKDAAEACGVETGTALYPMYHARVFDLISKALDQALADGQSHDARSNPIVVFPNGNGHAEWDGNMGEYIADNQMRAAATADPVGFDPVIEAHEEGPDAPTDLYSPAPPTYQQEQEELKRQDTPFDPPKKKRGRPKGSKAKKAKPAKAKAAKPAVVEDATGAADLVVAAPETPEPTTEATL